MPERPKRPEWLRLSPVDHKVRGEMGRFLRGLDLHTVCESARCPNREECFGAGTATFMILGDVCTRNCTFCAVDKGGPLPPDPQEPEHIMEAVRRLNLRYVVVTSVTRDDLPDGGAGQFAEVIRTLRRYDPAVMVEVLVPDFQGLQASLQAVVEARPAVFNHNIETVPRLYPEVRPKANYQRSLDLLKQAKQLDAGLLTKSGLMVGLGESLNEIITAMQNLREAGCDFLTIGQYLQPSLKHHEVVRYVPPEEFAEYKKIGEKLGFAAVVSGPLVRSSFHAADTFRVA